jgi:hypothetical protein
LILSFHFIQISGDVLAGPSKIQLPYRVPDLWSSAYESHISTVGASSCGQILAVQIKSGKKIKQ